MIQRLQSLYLLAASLLCVACLCLPVGHFITEEGLCVANLYNLVLRYSPQFVVDGMVGYSYRTWALFAVLLIVSVLSFADIFLFRRRALQMRLCTFSMLLLMGWYVLYAFFVFKTCSGLESGFRPGWAVSLPFSSIVLLYLAFRRIMKDEMLVRSLDRLR